MILPILVCKQKIRFLRLRVHSNAPEHEDRLPTVLDCTLTFVSNASWGRCSWDRGSTHCVVLASTFLKYHRPVVSSVFLRQGCSSMPAFRVKCSLRCHTKYPLTIFVFICRPAGGCVGMSGEINAHCIAAYIVSTILLLGARCWTSMRVTRG